jgi:hypothetical protein
MGKVYMGDETRWWACPSCGGRGYSISAIASALLMSVIVSLSAYRLFGGGQAAPVHVSRVTPPVAAAAQTAPAMDRPMQPE